MRRASNRPFECLLLKLAILITNHHCLRVNPQDIEALHSRLVTFFLDTMTEVELVVPYGKEGVLADIRKNVHVLSESYEEKGVCLKVKANAGTLTALKRRLAS